MSNPRVPYVVALPVDTPPLLSRTLTSVLQDHAREINRKAFDTTRVSSTQAVASNMVLVDAAAKVIVLTLPAAKEWQDEVVRVKKMDSSANQVKVVTTDSETIDGTLTVALTIQYSSLQLFSDGGQWLIT